MLMLRKTARGYILKVKWIVSCQSCPTLCSPMDYSLPCSFIHWILQARILEWVAIPFSRGLSWCRDQTQVSSIAGSFFSIWATRVQNSTCVLGSHWYIKKEKWITPFRLSVFSWMGIVTHITQILGCYYFLKTISMLRFYFLPIDMKLNM